MDSLLQEDNTYLLQEINNKILLEQQPGGAPTVSSWRMMRGIGQG